MRFIFSRKGFDSSVGGIANPILPDGRMLSLPIPSSLDSLSYERIGGPDGKTLGAIIGELTGSGHFSRERCAHLDPDLLFASRPRLPDWRASLGQIGAAAGHLRNQGVTLGDLFLFYGWFRQTEYVQDHLRFVPHERGFHAIFGYLEVGTVLSAPTLAELPVWLRTHPHAIVHRLSKPSNTFYIAADKLTHNHTMPGAGVFRFAPHLVLSHSSKSRSRWSLDREIFGHLTISYHTPAAWKVDHFQSYPRAQEYVVHADERSRIWAMRTIESAQRWELPINGSTASVN